MTATTIILVGYGLMALWAVIWLNILEHRRRAKMTPAEREADDAELRHEAQIW
jgi:hypothetical protein